MSTKPVISSGRWACVSAGEYDERARHVVVNEAVVDVVAHETGQAPELVRAAIVAHEVAHACAPGGMTREDEERRARAAAVAAAGRGIVDAIDRALLTGWYGDCSRS